MHAFEQLIALTLEQHGWWTRIGHKVNLTPGDKRAIGRPSSPRWELDIVAYKAAINELLVVECKSLMDSRGVRMQTVFRPKSRKQNRFELFNEDKTRRVVFTRLRRELEAAGAIRPRAKVILGLATGKISTNRDREELASEFNKRKWRLFDEQSICGELTALGDDGYRNDAAAFVAKLMLRHHNWTTDDG